jgi:hypothetical protein
MIFSTFSRSHDLICLFNQGYTAGLAATAAIFKRQPAACRVFSQWLHDHQVLSLALACVTATERLPHSSLPVQIHLLFASIHLDSFAQQLVGC